MAERRARLEGKVAIVTGGGSSGPGLGNGKAMSILFAREGARVAVLDRRVEAANETVRLIADEGGEAVAVAGDVTRADDCAAVVAEAVARWGGLDILINNVGVGGRPLSVVEVSESEWDRIMAINTKGTMLASKYGIPAIAASGGGAVVNISSVAALVAGNLTAYAASKGAIISLTRAMAGQHAPQGIRVNCVVPGQVWTPLVQALAPEGPQREALRERRRNSSLLKTEGTAWDVAYAALFLASEEARWITGQTIVVDAGRSLAGGG